MEHLLSKEDSRLLYELGEMHIAGNYIQVSRELADRIKQSQLPQKLDIEMGISATDFIENKVTVRLGVRFYTIVLSKEFILYSSKEIINSVFMDIEFNATSDNRFLIEYMHICWDEVKEKLLVICFLKYNNKHAATRD